MFSKRSIRDSSFYLVVQTAGTRVIKLFIQQYSSVFILFIQYSSVFVEWKGGKVLSRYCTRCAVHGTIYQTNYRRDR